MRRCSNSISYPRWSRLWQRLLHRRLKHRLPHPREFQVRRSGECLLSPLLLLRVTRATRRALVLSDGLNSHASSGLRRIKDAREETAVDLLTLWKASPTRRRLAGAWRAQERAIRQPRVLQKQEMLVRAKVKGPGKTRGRPRRTLNPRLQRLPRQLLLRRPPLLLQPRARALRFLLRSGPCWRTPRRCSRF